MARKPTIEEPKNPVRPGSRYIKPLPPKNDSVISTPMKVGGKLPSEPTPPSGGKGKGRRGKA